MLTIKKAREIADKFIQNLGRSTNSELEIIDSETLEREIGWVFFYDSSEYVKTGNFKYRLVGNSPILISRDSGEVRELGTARPLEEYLKELS